MSVIECSVCFKVFEPSDKIATGSCGHLVHYFKQDCKNSDICAICQQEFWIYSKAQFVKLNLKSAEVEAAAEPQQERNLKQESHTGLEYNKESDSNKFAFLQKQIEILSNITDHLISKVKVSEEITVKSNKMFKEQQEILKQVMGTVKQSQSDIVDLKADLKEIENCLDEITGSVFDCDYCCAGDKSNKQSF